MVKVLPFDLCSTFSSGHATTSEAMSWLESQGITMISGDGSLITSAVESGQTITLTGLILKVFLFLPLTYIYFFICSS